MFFRFRKIMQNPFALQVPGQWAAATRGAGLPVVGRGRSGWIVVLQRVARSCALFLPATTVPINVLSWYAALVRHPVARSDRLPSVSGCWHRREVGCDPPALEIQCNLKCEFKQEQSEDSYNIYAAFRSYRFRRLAWLKSMPESNAANSCAVIS